MVNPNTVDKLLTLKALVKENGSSSDEQRLQYLLNSFLRNGTLTKDEAREANDIYRQVKNKGVF